MKYKISGAAAQFIFAAAVYMHNPTYVWISVLLAIVSALGLFGILRNPQVAIFVAAIAGNLPLVIGFASMMS